MSRADLFETHHRRWIEVFNWNDLSASTEKDAAHTTRLLTFGALPRRAGAAVRCRRPTTRVARKPAVLDLTNPCRDAQEQRLAKQFDGAQ